MEKRNIKFANRSQFAGFNPAVVAKMTFDQFAEAHKFWGADRNMSPQQRAEDLKSIYEKCKEAAGKANKKPDKPLKSEED